MIIHSEINFKIVRGLVIDETSLALKETDYFDSFFDSVFSSTTATLLSFVCVVLSFVVVTVESSVVTGTSTISGVAGFDLNQSHEVANKPTVMQRKNTFFI